MKVDVAADTTALQAWFDAHPGIGLYAVTHDGTQFVIVYADAITVTATYTDRVNTR